MTQSEAKMRILAEWRTWVGHRPATDSCHRNGAVAGFFDKCRAKVIAVEAEAFAAEGGFRCRLRRSRNLELKSRRTFALCGLRARVQNRLLMNVPRPGLYRLALASLGRESKMVTTAGCTPR